MFKLLMIVAFVNTSIFAFPFDYNNDDENDGRIIGGSSANPGQFPYQASLRLGDLHYCSGSILSCRWIVTAAHCVYAFPPPMIDVVVGTTLLNDSYHRYPIDKVIVHSEWNSDSFQNDIGLIRTKTTIQFNYQVWNVPLANEYIGNDIRVILSGWGSTSNSATPENELNFIQLKTISVEECKDKFSSENDINEKQLCTFTRKGEGACYGDSGSPLVLHKIKGHYLVGFLSWGIPCGKGYPDVFTRISSFTEWILEKAV